ncbi:hypothetical protein QYE76_062529 [Lolium multiflorum]|uniref:Uncharacterized protein n=1 Tax=Lolium multiflorum TaxID=4521 RepID=A0AAD8S3S2_LOLMU|nr:hypothetical protein QYE76_062529 [Lolium multiflorum]
MASSSSATALAAALGAPPTQLLTRDNALIWKALVVPALRGACVLDLVEGEDKAPDKVLETEDSNGKKVTIQNPNYASWIARDQQVLRWLLNALSPDVLTHVIGLETSAEVWEALNSHVSASSKSRVQHLRTALVETKKNTMSVEKYFSKMKTIAQELAAAGKPIDDDELVWYVLKNLGGEYNNLITAVRANPNTTLSDLFGQVQSFDRLHKTEDTSFTSSANLARRGGGAPSRGQDDRGGQGNWRDDHGGQDRWRDDRPRHDDGRGRGGGGHRGGYQGRDNGGYQDHCREDDRSRRRDDGDRRDDGGRRRDRQPTRFVDTTCQICTIYGHPAKDCWWRYEEDRERCDNGDRGRKDANFTSHGVDTNWYYDTGATDHITGELNKLSTHDDYHGRDQVRTAEGTAAETTDENFQQNRVEIPAENDAENTAEDGEISAETHADSAADFSDPEETQPEADSPALGSCGDAPAASSGHTSLACPGAPPGARSPLLSAACGDHAPSPSPGAPPGASPVTPASTATPADPVSSGSSAAGASAADSMTRTIYSF